jgi:hypothetical protein
MINDSEHRSRLSLPVVGFLCLIAGGACLAKGLAQSPSVIASSAGERNTVSCSSAFLRDTGIPQFASITPRYTTKRIVDIEVGEEVVAKDPESGEVTTKRVANVFRKVSDHLRILQVRNPLTNEVQTIETTDDHPFWVPARREWIDAKDLKLGDRLDDVDGGTAILESTSRELHPEGIPVFNFEVEDFHTYFVRAHGSRGPPVLTHNIDCHEFQTIIDASPTNSVGFPGTGVFGDGVGVRNSEGYKPDLVYRALRREEMSAALETGLVAKNTNLNITPLDHIVDGSTPGFESQFISVTRDPRLAERWARRSGTAVVTIDLNQVGSPVLDLSTSAGRTRFLGDASRAFVGSRLQEANRLSRNASELLIRQSVSPSAIKSLRIFP